ncbi:pseudouridine synthase [Nitrosomonas sp.]|uniref:pseudouridine synthase n=1 Tax=Nitrosomonas sp. TaxID=42353 RepID=UPI001DD92454|nr:pseudouridine synthase [Nitrosomonas sp.]MCB1948326.1 rRNA pseudouridine synthase [Nitrosomonas sp.]MDR4514065.1 rRNA pseudouridine synthase [Nitrosomonas sp.]
MEKIRLSKLMSEQGLCSRREADSYIERGWVFVDGKRVSKVGSKIYPEQKITLHSAARLQQLRLVTILINKPIGYVSGQPEPGHRPAIQLIKAETLFQKKGQCQTFKPEHLKNLAPAGRLDIDSQGLLIFTQDGRIARQLIGNESSVEKEYLVRVRGGLSEEKLALLNHGLSLDGKALKPAIVQWQNKDQLRFILREGKKRQIRRMCELVGLQVIGLKRVRIGQIRLSNLPEGQWRYLEEGERF